MANTLESQLYNTLKGNSNPKTVKELIDQGVDCNLAHFDRDTRTFISPIRSAAKTYRHNPLFLLYEHRNSPTKRQLDKHVAFYINHRDQSQNEKNEILLDYTVSRLLYIRITDHPRKIFDTFIAALHDFDGAKRHRKCLSKGFRPEIFLQLRIYTLFRKIIDMKINSGNNSVEVIEKELLHNLETYYFLDGISYIPVRISEEIDNQTFSHVKSLPSHHLLMKYYECIATNLISKIKRLKINEEYTIPTGWQGHAVCVSFLRVGQTHISIRIDNPSPDTPPGMHKIVHSTTGFCIIKPKVLGQLHENDLEVNLDCYFVLLIDSIKRNLTLEEGSSLIYSLNEQIRNLDKTQIDVPSFLEQARANCFVKCFEPGYWIRFGERHQKLYHQLLLLEKNNANFFASRCVERHQRSFDDLFNQFTSLAEKEDISTLSETERTRLQDKLKMSYKQHYKNLSNSANTEHCHPLDENYVPLRFKNENTSIELKNLFIGPRLLLLGEAGCGKTTVCQYITYSWSIGKKLWQNQFDWVFYIKMRNLNSELYLPQPNEYSLIDIIDRECFVRYKFQDSDKEILTNLLETSSNVLWILDGCDERTIPEYLRFLEKELLTKPNLLLTSRPDPTDDLEYDITIQIQSFTPKDIEDYIHNYFSYTLRTTGNECWLFIKDSSQLKQTACIPACLEIICSLWESGKVRLDIGMTEGELYQKMCDHLLQRYLLKFHRMCNSSLVGRDMYREPNAVAFAHLERLAFEATKSHRLTISGKEITNVAGSQSLSVLQVVLLIPQTRNPPSVLLENVYYFVHRSFQEYLCARYMIRILESSDFSSAEDRSISIYNT